MTKLLRRLVIKKTKQLLLAGVVGIGLLAIELFAVLFHLISVNNLVSAFTMGVFIIFFLFLIATFVPFGKVSEKKVEEAFQKIVMKKIEWQTQFISEMKIKLPKLEKELDDLKELKQ